jgi:hypothetical protein
MPPENSRQLSKPIAPVTNPVPTVRYSAARTPDPEGAGRAVDSRVGESRER